MALLTDLQLHVHVLGSNTDLRKPADDRYGTRLRITLCIFIGSPILEHASAENKPALMLTDLKHKLWFQTPTAGNQGTLFQ